jgi:hypothetical protein
LADLPRHDSPRQRWSHDWFIAYGEYKLDIVSIVYNTYRRLGWTDKTLATLRPWYPDWPLVDSANRLLRYSPVRVACEAVATVDVETVES